MEDNVEHDLLFPAIFKVTIRANTIDGDLECEGNTPAPELFGGIVPDPILNSVDGDAEGQCADLAIDGDDDSS